MDKVEPIKYIVDCKSLPKNFPTHRHPNKFWEALGRTVATFGFLEEILAKAIFSFTSTREIPEEQALAEFEKWIPTLERALSDPLGGLIDAYGKAVRTNEAKTITNLDILISDLREASAIRNVLCHGSWGVPDNLSRSVPFFVNNKSEVFSTPIDVAFLDQTRSHVANLACNVINTVTHMGWQFPGSNGPGIPIV